MRPALGLFTALPLGWQGEDLQRAWAWAGAAGLVIGLAWVIFHQALAGVGLGPFAAAAAVLVIDTVFTGARGLRGVAGIAATITGEVAVPAAPGAGGGGAAAVSALVVLRAALITLLGRGPGLLVLVPLAGRVAQAAIIGPSEAEELQLPAPSTPTRVRLLLTTVPLLLAPVPLGYVVIPRTADPAVAGVGVLTTGLIALAVAIATGRVTLAWARARMGRIDADVWHAAGMSAEIAALIVVVVRASGVVPS